MLFHVKHVHTPEKCPAHDPELLKTTFGKIISSADEVGVKLIGAYVDPPAHTLFFIIDADSVEKIDKFLDPAFEIGTAEIRPVDDVVAAIKRRTE